MGSDDLIEVCAAADVAPGAMLRAEPPGCEPLAVYNVGGAFYVTSDTCTHGEASLASDGVLQGHTVECGWHYGAFDVRTGEATASPCEISLKRYEVVQKDGKLFVRA